MIYISFMLFMPIALLSWVLYRFIIYKKSSQLNVKREFTIALFILYLLILSKLTIFKSGVLEINMTVNLLGIFIPLLQPITFTNYNTVTLILNNVILPTLLFIPLGIFIPLLFRKKNIFINIIIYSLTLSLFINILSFDSIHMDYMFLSSLGSIIGFISFNYYKVHLDNFNTFKLLKVISSDFNGSLLLISVKALALSFGLTTSLAIVSAYNNTISGDLNNDQIARSVFSENSSENYIAFADYFNYKLFLAKDNSNLELKIANKVLTNRWSEGVTTTLNLSDESYGYSVMILDNESSKGVVVFGKNNDAQAIEIVFNGKKYTEPLQTDTYFLVTFPTFEVLKDDSDILNIYTSEGSKDLVVQFIEQDGNECTHMKLIK